MLQEPQWDQLEPGGWKWDRWGWDSHRKKPVTVQGVREPPFVRAVGKGPSF